MRNTAAIGVLVLLPSIVFGASAPSDFEGLVGIVTNLISLIIPIILGITFVVLMWGIVKAWIISGGDEKAIESGKRLAIVGIIAFTVMLGIWGILEILRSTFFGG